MLIYISLITNEIDHFLLLLLSIFALYYALNFSINLLFFSFVALETFLVLLDMIQYHVQFSSVGIMFSSVQLLSCVQLFATPWTAAHWVSLSITNSQSLLNLMSTESVMLSNCLIFCHPLLCSIFPNIRVFTKESVLCKRWPKYWSFSFTISPSNEFSGLISFRIERFDILAVQGTLKSLLQHHSSEASILWLSAFFIVQLLYPCTTTRKPVALTGQTFVSKVMSLLFNMMSRLVIAFLPRIKHLLISWLQSPSAVILEPSKMGVMCQCHIGLFQLSYSVI